MVRIIHKRQKLLADAENGQFNQRLSGLHFHFLKLGERAGSASYHTDGRITAQIFTNLTWKATSRPFIRDRVCAQAMAEYKQHVQIYEDNF